MSFISNEQLFEIEKKLSSDKSLLGKIYKAKKSENHQISVDHNLVDDYLKDGYEIDSILKTKTKLVKPKPHSKRFEDEIWCQFYDLGFRTLNIDEKFELPFGKNPNEKNKLM
ncbi:MAG: hypothetical protein O2831_08085 [Bacteroidetes bacterium]|nr:hypothetical protein [Bacteroidota bacterium]